jgi:phage virion morphogenesis protein
MSTFNVLVNDKAIQAKLTELASRTTNLRPALTDIGEALKIQIDRYFAAQTGPDGKPWAANQLDTVKAYGKQRGGYSKKTGQRSARGKAIEESKKILQGLTGDLRRQIYWRANESAVVLGSPMKYAAIHQYGGQFKAWGKTTLTMPSRPFMPVDQNDNLYPAAQALILKRLEQHLSQLK